MKECVTFIIRCLQDADSVEWETVMEDAKEIGLIKESENETFKADKIITRKDFRILLSRMLEMNRYLYFYSDEYRLNNREYDKEGSIKYSDWVIERKNTINPEGI